MVRRCVQKNTGLEFAAKIINTVKLSARGWYRFPLIFMEMLVRIGTLLVVCAKFSVGSLVQAMLLCAATPWSLLRAHP